MKHILIFASYGPSLINFRLDLIKKILSKGHKVSVAAPSNKFSNKLKKKLIDLGINVNIFSLTKTGLNLFKEFKSIYEIYKVIKSSKPDIIISYTSKPVIYTGLVLKFFPKINYYPLITGLGFPYTDVNSIKKKFLKYLTTKLYQEALKRSVKVIYQNKDDELLFFKLKIVTNKKKTFIVNGSGVDLKFFSLTRLPSRPIFLMASRLLIYKGVREYVEAAKIVSLNFPNVKFQLAGGIDENPSSISLHELKSWIKFGVIEYLGEKNNIRSILKSCKYFVLPSYYREGVPRSILEALAVGRPIITTDSVGCRSTVTHKKNGLLVPVKNSIALAKAMMKLLNEKEKNIKKMAKKSYILAKKKYDINKVNKRMLEIIRL